MFRLLVVILLLNGSRVAAMCLCWADSDCKPTSSCPGNTCRFAWWIGVGTCVDSPAGPSPPLQSPPPPPPQPPTNAPGESRVSACNCFDDSECLNSPLCPNDCVFPPWGAPFGTCSARGGPPAVPPSQPPQLPPTNQPVPPTLPPVPPPTQTPVPPPTQAPVPPIPVEPTFPPNNVVGPGPGPNIGAGPTNAPVTGGGPAIGSSEVVPSRCDVANLIILMDQSVRVNTALAPQWLRLAFHDAGTFDQRSGVGGANGCLINNDDMRRQEDNLNLDLAIESLVLVRNFWGFPASAADLIQFAGFFSSVRQKDIPGLNGIKTIELLDNFQWGRPDESDCRIEWTLNLPAFDLGVEPLNDLAARCQAAGVEIKDKMVDRNGFSVFEATALIGAHTIGLTRHVFGEDTAGPWIENGSDEFTRNGPVFDNGFHSFLVNDVEATTIDEFARNRNPFTTNFPTWLKVDTANLNYLDTDLVLAFPTPDGTVHPDYHTFTRLFADNNDFFIRAFMASMDKMSRLGVRTGLFPASECSESTTSRAPGASGPPGNVIQGAAFEDLMRSSLSVADVLLENTAAERAAEIQALTTPVEG